MGPFWSSFILVVFYFDCLPFWSSSILVVFHFGRLPFWSCSILAVFHFGRLPFWSSFILDVFHFGRRPFWSSFILVLGRLGWVLGPLSCSLTDGLVAVFSVGCGLSEQIKRPGYNQRK